MKHIIRLILVYIILKLALFEVVGSLIKLEKALFTRLKSLQKELNNGEYI